MIVGLFPELSAAGGIQRAGRLTAAALQQFASERGEECIFLSLNDSPDAPALQLGLHEVAFSGFGRSKSKFLASAMRAGLARPRLVVALHPHLAPAAEAVKLFSPRSRSVVFAHGIEVWKPLKASRRWALRRSDLVIGPSTYTVQQLVAQQCVAEYRVRKLCWSLGPEVALAAAPCAHRRTPDGLPSGRLILAVGRWDAREAYKGVDHVIMALAALVREIPDLHLLAVGDGTDLPRLRALSEKVGVSGHVHFLPWMQPEELSAAYCACEVFTLPSQGEGFGLVFLEAMSFGKPAIGGAHGGTPEIIEDGISGYLVPYGDVAVLTERLRGLLTDESCRRLMGERAYERVCSKFTYQRFSAELTDLLQGLLIFDSGAKSESNR